MDRAMPRPSLKDFNADSITSSRVSVDVVPIDFQDNEATRRLVMHSARRVISQHKDEIQELAYK